MDKKMLCGLIAGILVGVLASGCGGGDKGSGNTPAVNQTPATQAPVLTSAAPQAGKADYSRYLTVEEVQSISGRSNLKLKSVDAKKSGESPDLTYSTAEGQVILMVQVLKGSDYERYYKDLRCQDYKPMEYAFWGPKTATPANPPTLLGFRKGDTLIIIESRVDGKNKPYLDAGMMEKMSKIIASRIE